MCAKRAAKPAPAEAVGYRNRIVGYGEEPPEQLLANPHNWRIHSTFQQEVLDGALREVGWAQNVIVNRRSGQLVDGHMRVTLAMRAGMPAIPVTYVDLSEEEEKKILASLDPIGGLAIMDAEQLGELVSEMHVEDEALAGFVEGLQDQAALLTLSPDGSPSEGATNAPAQGVIVRVAIVVKDVHVLERALAATGEVRRDVALLQICQAYLDAKG